MCFLVSNQKYDNFYKQQLCFEQYLRNEIIINKYKVLQGIILGCILLDYKDEGNGAGRLKVNCKCLLLGYSKFSMIWVKILGYVRILKQYTNNSYNYLNKENCSCRHVKKPEGTQGMTNFNCREFSMYKKPLVGRLSFKIIFILMVLSDDKFHKDQQRPLRLY